MQWWCAAAGIPWEWRWRPYPGVWLFVLVLAGLGWWRWRSASRPRRGAGWSYGLGVGALWVALDWPVGALGAGYLVSVHMVQFLLIAMIAPPFLIMGWYGFGGSEPSRGGGPGHLAARAFTHPLVTLALFGAALGWTHWPPAVDALMVSQAGSLLLDLTWLGAGVLFWWPVVGPVGGREWLTDPIRMGYLFLGGVVSTGVFAYLTFSELPLYATYELAPPISSLSSRDDQLVAGLLMKGGGALVLWTWISVLFFRWYRAEGREPGPRPS